MQKVGFIGAGVMATAMMSGIINSKLYSANDILVYDISSDRLAELKNEYAINTTDNLKDLAINSEIIIFAVKPNVLGAVLEELSSFAESDRLYISIAAGKEISFIEGFIGPDKRIVRAMPNTAAMVSKAASGLCKNTSASDDDMAMAKNIFESFGIAEVVDEKLMHAVTGVSGSSPAYIYMMIEAMMQAAIADGLSAATARRLAAAAAEGAAKMVLDSDEHPAQLRDAVCSPGGTTIEAVESLQEDGFMGSVIRAQRKCVEKSKELGK